MLEIRFTASALCHAIRDQNQAHDISENSPACSSHDQSKKSCSLGDCRRKSVSQHTGSSYTNSDAAFGGARRLSAPDEHSLIHVNEFDGTQMVNSLNFPFRVHQQPPLLLLRLFRFPDNLFRCLLGCLCLPCGRPFGPFGHHTLALIEPPCRMRLY